LSPDSIPLVPPVDSTPLLFGVLLTAVHGGDVPAQQQVAEHAELMERAVGYGFDLVMVGQHFLPEGLRYYQPIPYLAWLGTQFPTVRVGTGIVLLSLSRPIDVAEEMATLDVVTGGRAVFGIGLGYTDREFAALGIPRADRVKRLEQGLELIRSLWSGERTEHHGIFGDFVVEQPIICPIQAPGPPVWMAGQGPAPVKRAARLSDAWYPPPFLSHTELREMSALYHAERSALGRPAPTQVPIRREVYLAATAEEAADAVGPYAVGRSKTYMKWGMKGETGGQTAMNTENEHNLDRRLLLGPPSAVAAGLQQLRTDIGMTDFILRVQWPGMPHAQSMEQLRIFGEEVVPLMRESTQ
jgi:alkanesulfonate monooxygenase SsuD/methylene tetrahydromethanopterin reductase-like flavin-dependent oxidoreductase (luciferase family)